MLQSFPGGDIGHVFSFLTPERSSGAREEDLFDASSLVALQALENSGML